VGAVAKGNGKKVPDKDFKKWLYIRVGGIVLRNMYKGVRDRSKSIVYILVGPPILALSHIDVNKKHMFASLTPE
jgi:hypothetical protein